MTTYRYDVIRVGYPASGPRRRTGERETVKSFESMVLSRTLNDERTYARALVYATQEATGVLFQNRIPGELAVVFNPNGDLDDAPLICLSCDGTGWCEGSPAFKCNECDGSGWAYPITFPVLVEIRSEQYGRRAVHYEITKSEVTE